MTIRDQILKSKLDSEIVAIPEWGDVKVEVREKTVDEQYELLDKVRKKDGSIDNKLLSIETILSTVFDPDTGERVFEDADRDALKSLPAAGFNKLLAAANRGAGLETEEDVTADLDATPAAETSTG